MRYLGRLHGEGVVTQSGRDIGRASYDIEGFAVHQRGVTGSGEIRLETSDLDQVFGSFNVRLRTDDGHLLDLHFSEKKRGSDGDVAYVDIRGGLPIIVETWRN